MNRGERRSEGWRRGGGQKKVRKWVQWDEGQSGQVRGTVTLMCHYRRLT